MTISVDDDDDDDDGNDMTMKMIKNLINRTLPAAVFVPIAHCRPEDISDVP